MSKFCKELNYTKVGKNLYSDDLIRDGDPPRIYRRTRITMEEFLELNGMVGLAHNGKYYKMELVS